MSVVSPKKRDELMAAEIQGLPRGAGNKSLAFETTYNGGKAPRSEFGDRRGQFLSDKCYLLRAMWDMISNARWGVDAVTGAQFW
jgi:hypothetical protein